MARDYSLRLPAKVEAVNKANKRANEFVPKYLELLKPLVGKKILLVTGGLVKKYEFLKIPDRDIRLRISTYSLWLSFNTWAKEDPAGEHQQNYTADVYVGEINSGVLDAVAVFNKRKTDYNANDVRQKLLDAQKLEEEARAAKSACGPFGMFDQ